MRAAFISVVLLAAPARAQTPTAMAIALQPTELSDAQIAALEDALTSAADELFTEPVAGPGDVAEVGAENAELSACDSVFCWSRLGRELSVGLVLVTRVAIAGDKLLLSIRLIDTSTERVVLRRQQPIGHDVLTYASDCRAVMQSLRSDLPAALRAALRGAAPLAAAPPPTPAPPAPEPAPPPPATERVQLADSAVDHAGWLGVKHVSVDFEEAQKVGLSPPLGAQIVELAPDGSAATAGLRAGDVVIDYGGHAVKSRVDLLRLVRRTPSGTVVPITVWRDRSAVVVPTRMVAREEPAGVATAPTPSTEPDPPRTVTNDTVNVSDAGFSYTHEEVTEVTDPVDNASFVNWALTGIVMLLNIDAGMFKQSSSTLGGGVGLSVRYLDPSGYFPGPEESGGRHCLSVSAGGMISATRMSYKSEFVDFTGLIGSSTDEGSSTLAYMELAGTLAYTYLSFGEFNPETLEQSGWGITLGIQGGISKNFGSLPMDLPEGLNDELTGIDVIIRPVIGLEFPSYNPGTGDVSMFSVVGFIWPVPDSFSLTLALAGSF